MESSEALLDGYIDIIAQQRDLILKLCEIYVKWQNEIVYNFSE